MKGTHAQEIIDNLDLVVDGKRPFRKVTEKPVERRTVK